MKKTIILIVAAIASCACGRFDFTEEDWELLYPEMNAHLKYLCIDEDALFDEFDDILGLSYIEYLPDAAKILDSYISEELESYQALAELPDLNGLMEEDIADALSQQFLGISPAKECMTILCDYVRDQFNAQEDFSLTFPEFCNMYIDNDDLIYYTTYCMDTGEYYLVTRDDITGELNYILTAVDPIEIASL